MPLVEAGKTIEVSLGLSIGDSSTVYELDAYPMLLTAGMDELGRIYLSRMPSATITDEFWLRRRVPGEIVVRDVSFDNVTGHAYVMFNVISGDNANVVRYCMPIFNIRENGSFKEHGTPFVLNQSGGFHNCVAVHNNVLHTLNGSIARTTDPNTPRVATTVAYDLDIEGRTENFNESATYNASKNLSIPLEVPDSPIVYMDMFQDDVIVWSEGYGLPDENRRLRRRDNKLLSHFAWLKYRLFASKHNGSTIVGDKETLKSQQPMLSRCNPWASNSGVATITGYLGAAVDTAFTKRGTELDQTVWTSLQEIGVNYRSLGEDAGAMATYTGVMRTQNGKEAIASADWQTTSVASGVNYPTIASDRNSPLMDRGAFITSPRITDAETQSPEVVMKHIGLNIDGKVESFNRDGEVESTVPRRRTVTFAAISMPEFALTAPGGVGFLYDGFSYTIEDIVQDLTTGEGVYIITCTYRPTVA